MDVYRVLNAVLKQKLVTLYGAKGSGKVCWLLGDAIGCIITLYAPLRRHPQR